MRLWQCLGAVIILCVWIATPAAAFEPGGPSHVISLEEAIGLSVRQKLAGAAAATTEAADRDALTAFYAAHDNEPVWVAETGFSANAVAIVEELRRADDWGLRASDFDVAPLPVAREGGRALDREELATAELELWLAILKYARHARGGRIEDPAKQLTSYLDRKPQVRAPKLVIEEIAAAPAPDAYLRGLNPKHPQFEKLRQKYLALRTGGTEPSVRIPASGPRLKPGHVHEDIAAIRARLGLAPNGEEAFYDDELADAVRSFQEQEGIEPANGLITRETRRGLNAGAGTDKSASLDAVLANMEAWRWMPQDLGATYVWVNIPEFTVRVVKNGEVIHAERIIAGKPDTQTPIFSDKMETVVIHPHWNVPDSIKVKEIWPGLAAGGSLAQRGLRVQYNGRDINSNTVDWAHADIRNYHVYQPSGGSNALGIVKFLFPNKHSVYLHDTPTKNLFSSAERTFSHGCMRVRNPVRLAELLLAEDKGWDTAQVQQLFKDGPDNNNIALDHKIPVHVTYFTAWVDDDGKLRSARDVYGHEKRIALGLKGRWSEIAKTPDHLAPVTFEPVAVARDDEYYYYGDSGSGGLFSSGGIYGNGGYYRPPVRGRKPVAKKSFFGVLFGQN